MAGGIGLETLAYLKNSMPLGILGGSTSGAGIFLTSVTQFGKYTFNKYRDTRDYIRKFGKIKQQPCSILDKIYCYRVGMELAIKEAGLEDSLNKQ